MRMVVVLLTVCAGCAEAPGRSAFTVEWEKPGASQADFERDNRFCTARAEEARRRLIGGRDAVRAHNRVLMDCMRDRGWERPPAK